MFKYLLFVLALAISWGNADAQFFNRMTMAQRQELAAAKFNLPPILGDYYYVDSEDGSNNNSGLLPDQAYASVESAYVKCDSTAYDGIVLLKANGLGTAISWQKDGITMIGVSRSASIINNSAGAGTGHYDSLATLITVSGDYNRFINISFVNSGSSAIAITAVSITGTHNTVEGCNIVGGNATLGATGAVADLLINGGDDNTIIDCVIGSDNIDRSIATVCGNIKFDGSCLRNQIIGCQTLQQTNDDDHCAIWLVDSAGIAGNQIFRDCLFTNYVASGAMQTLDFLVAGEKASVTGLIILDQCRSVGWDSLSAASWDRVPVTSTVTSTAGGKAMYD